MTFYWYRIYWYLFDRYVAKCLHNYFSYSSDRCKQVHMHLIDAMKFQQRQRAVPLTEQRRPVGPSSVTKSRGGQKYCTSRWIKRVETERRLWPRGVRGRDRPLKYRKFSSVGHQIYVFLSTMGGHKHPFKMLIFNRSIHPLARNFQTEGFDLISQLRCLQLTYCVNLVNTTVLGKHRWSTSLKWLVRVYFTDSRHYM